MKLYQTIILIFLGLMVLLSYFTYLKTNKDGNYFTHPFWFNMDKNTVKFLTIFQIFAIIGFIVAIGTWLINPPKGGIMEKYLFLTLVVFFISAAIWPYATYNKIRWLSVLAVIFTAISSIFLLAGSIEENKPRLIVLCGLLFLCITTVLGDAVLWNANYIKSNQN